MLLSYVLQDVFSLSMKVLRLGIFKFDNGVYVGLILLKLSKHNILTKTNLFCFTCSRFGKVRAN